MRTITFSNNGTSDGQHTLQSLHSQHSQLSQGGHEWSPFELPYDMMFNDPQTDAHATYGQDDRSDEVHDVHDVVHDVHDVHDVHGYGNFLHDELQPQVEENPPEEIEDVAPAALERHDDPPESPVATSPVDKSSKKAATIVDPYAEGFLQESLGEDKWNLFSARLFERRLTGPRSKVKKSGNAASTSTGAGANNPETTNETTASVIDFLCKAEAVKEVLRVYVPHPYNPHKTLTHTYPKAPSGRVTLSRSTVLALSGWSNTQFSYWARRSEAIGVLAYHDRRLRMVAHAFSNRLRGTKIPDEVTATDGVTGKGLDTIIDEVKERTGASPFIHGKHSSLDPFTITETLPDGTPANPNGPWVDYDNLPTGAAAAATAAASSHFIPSTFNADNDSVSAVLEDTNTQMQYYLQNMEFGGVGGLGTIGGTMHPTDFDVNAASATSLTPTSAAPADTLNNAGAGAASPKRRGPGGIRAKRGSKDASVNAGNKDGVTKPPGKRKAANDSESSQQGNRKRAKTNASQEDS